MRGLRFDSPESYVFIFWIFFTNINRGGHFNATATINSIYRGGYLRLPATVNRLTKVVRRTVLVKPRLTVTSWPWW
jgi:hypothetical protein